MLSMLPLIGRLVPALVAAALFAYGWFEHHRVLALIKQSAAVQAQYDGLLAQLDVATKKLAEQTAVAEQQRATVERQHAATEAQLREVITRVKNSPPVCPELGSVLMRNEPSVPDQHPAQGAAGADRSGGAPVSAPLPADGFRLDYIAEDYATCRRAIDDLEAMKKAYPHE